MKRSRSSWLYIGVSVLVFFLLTLWLYGTQIFSNSLIVGGPGGDQAQEIWFLAWPLYAIEHGHNIFVSNWMNYPTGLNLMANTSFPLLGILFSPLTVIFGPVATLGILMRLGMILSAVSLQWVARRLGIGRVGSFVAGLFYGFSISQFAQGHGHLFLVMAPLPPLVLYTLYLLVLEKISPRRGGLTIGILMSADFLISQERALMTVFFAAVALVLAAILNFRQVTRDRLRYLTRSLGWTVVPMVVLLVYPIYEMMGTDSVKGATHPWIQGYASDLQSFVLPGPFTWWAPFGRLNLTTGAASAVENGSYIGIPLLLVLIFVAVRWWRVKWVRFGSLLTLIFIGLSLGIRLHVGGKSTSLVSPYKFIAALKYFNDVQPLRYFYFVWMGVGLLVGFGLDRGVRWLARHRGDERWHFYAKSALLLGLSVLIVASVIPNQTEDVRPTKVQPWLLSKEASQVMKPGSVTLMFPYPVNLYTTALLDQAVTGFGYKIVGGEAIVGNKQGVNVGIQPLSPLNVTSLFVRPLYGPVVGAKAGTLTGQIPGLVFTNLPPFPKLDVTTIVDMIAYVHLNHIDTVVVRYANGPQVAEMYPYLTDAFGPPNIRDQGTLYFWDHAQLQARWSSLVKAHPAVAKIR